MKYKTHGTTGNHKLFIRERETLFETTTPLKSTFGCFKNHTEMKTWEFAAFQKEQFAKKKKERKYFWMLIIISVIVALIVFFLTPIIIKSLNEAGNFEYHSY